MARRLSAGEARGLVAAKREPRKGDGWLGREKKEREMTGKELRAARTAFGLYRFCSGEKRCCLVQGNFCRATGPGSESRTKGGGKQEKEILEFLGTLTDLKLCSLYRSLETRLERRARETHGTRRITLAFEFQEETRRTRLSLL